MKVIVERRPLPSARRAAEEHLPYVRLIREDRLLVNKLAAILRLANALDAEHLQKVQERQGCGRRASRWILELEGTGDLTMERLAADGARRHVHRGVRAALVIAGAGVES